MALLLGHLYYLSTLQLADNDLWQQFLQSTLLLLVIGLCTGALLLFSFWYVGWRLLWQGRKTKSPFSHYEYLMPAEQLHFTAMQYVHQFLQNHPYSQMKVDLTSTLVCRKTGRIFSCDTKCRRTMKSAECYLMQHYSGVLVPWSTLNQEQKQNFVARHSCLKHFQLHPSGANTAFSYSDWTSADMKPGPLFVDLEAGVAVGWQCIPHTNLEIIIVQPPSK